MMIFPLGGAGHDSGGGSGEMVNPNYVPPSSVSIKLEQYWRCEYCDSVNKSKKTQCKNCGAPRRNHNE